MKARRILAKLSLTVYYSPIIIITLITPIVMRDTYILHILILFMYYGLLAEAWNILGGYGQISFGHQMFFGIGSYTSTMLFMYWGLSPWIGCMVGAGLAVVASAFIGQVCFRRNLTGIFFVFFTVSGSEVLRVLLLNPPLETWTRGALGITVPMIGDSPFYYQFSTKPPYYYIIFAILFTTLIVTYLLKKSRLGIKLDAVREDEIAAASLGVDATTCKIKAFMISAFFTSLAGTFYAQYIFYIDPYTTMGLEVGLIGILASIIGGLGTIFGPIVGSIVLTAVSEASRVFFGQHFGGIHLVIYGIIITIVMLKLPSGIVKKISERKK